MKKKQNDADVYFSAIENDVRTNVNSSWLELFCQRAMKMRDYSTRNVATALYQYPQATELAGEKMYNERGAEVLPGAVPIRIVSPNRASNGQTAKKWDWVDVYDVSQTTALPRKQYVADENEQLKKLYRWSKQAGFIVEYTRASLQSPKVVQGNNVYLQVGMSSAVAAELICQELIKVAFCTEKKMEPTMATALSAIASYCVSVGCGLSVPNLPQAHKLTACVGDGLLKNTDACLKMAKRVCQALRKS